MNIKTTLIPSIVFITVLTASVSSSVFASTSGITLDPNGDMVPIPVGNIPYFKMPNALAASSGSYTWDYSGTVANPNQRFSMQAVVSQIAGTGNGKLGLGFHMFDFGFHQGNSYFYSNSTYGGKNHTNQSLLQSLDLLSSKASFKNLNVSAALISNLNDQWHVSSVGRIPQAPLYQGWVGQPGHEYQLTGDGDTYLWKYNATTGAHTVAPYSYTFTIKMIDERGATMEGLGGGYVGPNLVTMKHDGKAYNFETELAQPRLKVLSWSVAFHAVSNTKTGFKSKYAFNGNSGLLWNDFGSLVRTGQFYVEKNTVLSNLIESDLSGAVKQKLHLSNSTPLSLSKAHSAGLYDGNWLPVEFTRGKYKGASLVFSVFWNKNAPHTLEQSTKYYDWSDYGWCNYFSGLIPNSVESATSLLETLYPQNPELPSLPVAETEKPPYTVSINSYVPYKFHVAHPWAQKVTIMIKPNTPLRYALASYADELAKSKMADNPNKPIRIILRAISPITQNTLFTKSSMQYYEGAAIPTMNGRAVGYAWIENMM